MIKNVPLDAITTGRVLSDDDDLTKLAESIAIDGIVVPIVVSSDFELIDGLRRLEVAHQLGLTEIPVLATSSFAEAAAGIKAAREHGHAMREVSGERVWELYKQLNEITFLARGVNPAGTPESSKRYLLTDALGLKSESLFQAITQIHRMAEHEDPAVAEKAQSLLERIKRGERTYYGSSNSLKRGVLTTGTIKKPAAQRSVIEDSLASLRGAIKALEQLATLDASLTRTELDGYLAELGVIRARVAKYVRIFREEIKNR